MLDTHTRLHCFTQAKIYRQSVNFLLYYIFSLFELTCYLYEFQEDEDTEPPKVLAFEEEESFLLSDCIDDKDCSMHANCVQPPNGHPYCKCRPGFRGNGIFCWEMMDYVPAEEQFLTDEELDNFDEPVQPEMPMNNLLLKTVGPQEIEEEQ